MKRRGLGRGLDAFLPAAAPDSGYREAPIDELSPNPNQPRAAPESADIEGLAASIAAQGVLEPVLVRRREGRLEIVAGERRWRAARKAGLETVPVVVREVSDGDLALLALVENLQRQDLNPIEEAAAFRRLAGDAGLTHEAIAREVGRSRAAVTNALRLLGLTPEVRKQIENGRLRAAAGRALAPLPADEQRRLAEEAVSRDLSVREVERRVRSALRAGEGKPRESAAKGLDANTRHARDRMEQSAGLPVEIRRRGKGGEVRVRFFSENDLQRVFLLLTSSARESADSES